MHSKNLPEIIPIQAGRDDRGGAGWPVHRGVDLVEAGRQRFDRFRERLPATGDRDVHRRQGRDLGCLCQVVPAGQVHPPVPGGARDQEEPDRPAAGPIFQQAQQPVEEAAVGFGVVHDDQHRPVRGRHLVDSRLFTGDSQANYPPRLPHPHAQLTGETGFALPTRTGQQPHCGVPDAVAPVGELGQQLFANTPQTHNGGVGPQKLRRRS
ncbi:MULTISPECIES: hypothetical protein [unclassified Pseudofrankia]|uniref:hypothetical protein n=1 Tax=unclassified Pseudofrankia TaxID=2994372 RepID=UPI0008D9B6CB|nr:MULTISPECIES: hypothetical protein [unclassified Pseudofrankia]MDT3446465.1 hypothetical protein [Pseudofrankia sp. BMG5.37]OHV59244.1 hypothetical protein BCD48_41770 [Pseudofrankia sp. BMG5.36]